ncbi:MAG: hypothetical protein KJO19_13580 [Woeseia sp.]|nr:hypothetical protein [Woeseia sp.]
MNNRSLLIVGLLFTGLATGCQDSIVEETVAAPATTASCAGCHQGKRSFSGRDAEELADAIRTIRDGELQHPPLGLQDPSDAAVDELAENLVGS